MNIKIIFSDRLIPDPDGQILQLLPDCPVPDPDTLQDYAAKWNIGVITPAFYRNGQRGMTCVTPDQQIFQPMCFPEEKDILSGVDIFPVTFPWGKLALCCEADVFQPQYARLAALRGCVLMAVSFPWQKEQLRMSGPWSVCQANCLPVALAQPEGGTLILPCPMTPDHSGFGRDRFDTGELAAAYREFPVFDSLNRDFYEKYREVLET